MAITTISNDISLSDIKEEEDDLTRGKLKVNPLTAALAVPFTIFMTQTWQPARLKEEALVHDLVVATQRVLYADFVLNGLVKKLDGALLMLTNKDRTAPIYLVYFGSQRPFEVAAGILGTQLETMRGWVPLLAASSEPALKAIGDEIKVAVDAADAAVKEKATAENALLVFKTTGERAQVIEAYNALRKVTYGELGKIKHEHPELPNDFADTFFRHESKRNDDKLSPEQLQMKIDSLAAQMAVLEQKRQAILDKQKADAEAKVLADQKQRQAALDAKKKEMEDLASTIKKMEDDLLK
jgi:hypothetical protein